MCHLQESFETTCSISLLLISTLIIILFTINYRCISKLQFSRCYFHPSPARQKFHLQKMLHFIFKTICAVINFTPNLCLLCSHPIPSSKLQCSFGMCDFQHRHRRQNRKQNNPSVEKTTFFGFSSNHVDLAKIEPRRTLTIARKCRPAKNCRLDC